jgi:hypothetical protein
MIINFDTNKFSKEMYNLIDYSVGFLDGIEKGKKIFLKNLSDGTAEALKQYIDSHARMNPQALQHVYEWYRTGSPEARLFTIDCKVVGDGISINSTFRQSNSVSKNNEEPFYNKARIMERGIPITIKPKASSVLVFEQEGQTIFTKKEIKIQYPGGPAARGSYEKIFDEFFRLYFSQAFLRSSGIFEYLENPRAYKNNIALGKKGGKSAGVQTGYNWIINAKVGVE